MATRTTQVFDAVEISIRKRQRNLAQRHLCDNLESDASSTSTSSTYFNGSPADVDSLLDTGVAPMIPGDNLGMGESQSDSATRSEKRLRTNLRFLEAMSAMNNYEIDVDPNNMVSYSGLAVGARVASRTVDRATDRGADEVSGRYIPLHPRETRKSMWNKRLETMWGTGRINRGSGPKPKANINYPNTLTMNSRGSPFPTTTTTSRSRSRATSSSSSVSRWLSTGNSTVDGDEDEDDKTVRAEEDSKKYPEDEES